MIARKPSVERGSGEQPERRAHPAQRRAHRLRGWLEALSLRFEPGEQAQQSPYLGASIGVVAFQAQFLDDVLVRRGRGWLDCHRIDGSSRYQFVPEMRPFEPESGVGRGGPPERLAPGRPQLPSDLALLLHSSLL